MSKEEKVDDRPIAGGQLDTPDTRRRKLAGKAFVFTAAQNNTYVHGGFLAALKGFCRARKAKLIISPFTYNKNGFQNGHKDDDSLWYDPKIKRYLCKDSVEIAQNLVFCGELDILPTAVNPTSGLENYTRHASSIIPHAKVQMKSIPTMKHEQTKFMYTTGAITMRNYIQRKAGQKASFHHVFGALYVEFDAEGDWFARQLVAANDGSFYDLTDYFNPTGRTRANRAAAINWGDIHAECGDDEVAEGAWSDTPGSILNHLRPWRQFVHDLTDFRARNHHGIKDPYFLARNRATGNDDVREGLRASCAFLQRINREDTGTVVVESNHDQALQRWLADPLGRIDIVNAEYWHELNAYIHRSIRNGMRSNVFEHALRGIDGGITAYFLPEDESYEICPQPDGPGIECGMHGHRGPNGARGSINSFQAVGKRANIGHSHSAGIVNGVYVAGVSAKLDLDYNVGPSSWSHSHIVTYPNSKRAIITMRGKKWRA